MDIHFQFPEVSPDALTPSCWGWLCAWGEGVFLFPGPTVLKKPRKNTKFHIPTK